jgi:hypothetical protein
MWQPVVRHLSIVTGLAGSLAAIVPGVLFWPRFSEPVYSASLARYYVVEMGIVGAAVLVVLLARASWATSAVWFASGLTVAFAAGAGFTIGTLYLPAGILFALSGLLADLNRPNMILRHLPIGIGAAAIQVAAMAIAVLRLTGAAK